MSDQTRINNPALQALRYHVSGAIERGDAEPIVEQPRTWDGEPMFSPETVQEHLFKREAFEQLQGQTAIETDKP